MKDTEWAEEHVHHSLPRLEWSNYINRPGCCMAAGDLLIGDATLRKIFCLQETLRGVGGSPPLSESLLQLESVLFLPSPLLREKTAASQKCNKWVQHHPSSTLLSCFLECSHWCAVCTCFFSSQHTHERLQILCYILKWWYSLKGHVPKINNVPGNEPADTMLGKQKQQLNSCKHQPHKQPKLRCKHAYLLCGNRFMLVRWGGGNIGGEIVKVDILKFSADDHIQALKRTQVIATIKSL